MLLISLVKFSMSCPSLCEVVMKGDVESDISIVRGVCVLQDELTKGLVIFSFLLFLLCVCGSPLVIYPFHPIASLAPFAYFPE